MKSLGHLKYGRKYDKIYAPTQFDISTLGIKNLLKLSQPF